MSGKTCHFSEAQRQELIALVRCELKQAQQFWMKANNPQTKTAYSERIGILEGALTKLVG